MAISDNWAVWGRDEHLEELSDQQNWHHIGLDGVPGRRPPAKKPKARPETRAKLLSASAHLDAGTHARTSRRRAVAPRAADAFDKS